MDVLHVLPVFVGGEGVHLDAERHAFLPAVLPGGELGADAVHLSQRIGQPGIAACGFMVRPAEGRGLFHYLDEYGSVFGRVPEELDGVEVQGV